MTEIGATHEGQTSIESNYHGDSGQYQYDGTHLFMYFHRLSAGSEVSDKLLVSDIYVFGISYFISKCLLSDQEFL